MRIALIMNDNSYTGREYLVALKDAGICVDLINIGHHNEVKESEDLRCGRLWVLKSTRECIDIVQKYDFKSLSDNYFFVIGNTMLVFREVQEY